MALQADTNTETMGPVLMATQRHRPTTSKLETKYQVLLGYVKWAWSDGPNLDYARLRLSSDAIWFDKEPLRLQLWNIQSS